MNSVEGRAWRFVEGVISVCDNLSELSGGRIKPVSLDGLMNLTERLIVTQDYFNSEGRPCHIDIGYHYTKPENMETIRYDGFSTTMSNLGHTGVYTGCNPYEFHGMYGN